MTSIFVSYRREDVHAARLVYNGLTDHFGERNVFFDYKSLEGGDPFGPAIEAAVSSSKAVVALVGPNWNSLDEDGKPELKDPGDWVRFELQKALKEGKQILPVLVAGGHMPSKAELPRTLKEFPGLHALELSNSRWDYDLGRVMERLEAWVGAPKQVRKRESPSEASAPLLRPPGGPTTRLPLFEPADPKFLERLKQEREQRQERKRAARESLPPFHTRSAFWVSATVGLLACFALVPAAMATVTALFETLPISTPQPRIGHPLIALGLCAAVWSVVYAGVAAAHYSDDPADGAWVFYGRGLLGGWVTVSEDLEPVGGLLGAFPLPMLVGWLLAKGSAWAALAFLPWAAGPTAYVVLAAYTLLAASLYVAASVWDLDL